MLPLRLPWVWWSLGWVLVAFVCVGSLVPGRYFPALLPNDKLLHLGTYLVLMTWFCGLYRRGRHVWVALLLFLLGLALDALQGTGRYRTFDLLDVTANAGGILLGWVLARSVFEGWCRRVEQLFLT